MGELGQERGKFFLGVKIVRALVRRFVPEVAVPSSVGGEIGQPSCLLWFFLLGRYWVGGL